MATAEMTDAYRKKLNFGARKRRQSQRPPAQNKKPTNHNNAQALLKIMLNTLLGRTCFYHLKYNPKGRVKHMKFGLQREI